MLYARRRLVGGALLLLRRDEGIRPASRAATWKGNTCQYSSRSRKNEDDEDKEIAYLGIDDKRVPEDQRPCDDIGFTATCGLREPEQELRRKTISVRAHREKDDDEGADLLPSSFPHPRRPRRRGRATLMFRNPALNPPALEDRLPAEEASLLDAFRGGLRSRRRARACRETVASE